MTSSLLCESAVNLDFAIASNTRCGSTWLATALANTGSHVNVDWEVKLEGYVRSSVHYPIGISDVPERLCVLAETLRKSNGKSYTSIGTKITLDVSVEPFHTISVGDRWLALERIRSSAPAMRFVHLTRGLCDQSQSPGGHSTRRPGPETASLLTEENRLLRNAVFEADCRPSADQPHIHRCDPQTVFHQFMNDVCLASALSGDARYLLVKYEHLHTDFPAILNFLDLPRERSLDELSLTVKNSRSNLTTNCSLGSALTTLRDYLVGAIAMIASDDKSREIIVEGATQLYESDCVRVLQAARSADQASGRELVHEIGRRLMWKLGFR